MKKIPSRQSKKGRARGQRIWNADRKSGRKRLYSELDTCPFCQEGIVRIGLRDPSTIYGWMRVVVAGCGSNLKDHFLESEDGYTGKCPLPIRREVQP